jgi:sec-independent protein translocase protein TatC
MSLGEHLRELRRRLIFCVAAVGVGALVAYFLYGHILSFFLHPYCQLLRHGHSTQPCTLYVQDPLDQLTIRLKITFFGGFALALPVILWQVWRFITPGLHPREKRYAVPFVLASVLFFAFGAFVALQTLPFALRFFRSFGGGQISTIYGPNPYLRLVILLIVVYGIGFEFPVLLVALELAGVVKSAQLRRWRRYAIVGITLASAVFTPSSDPFSMFALAIPLYVFYEGTILIGRMLKR